MKYVFSNLLFEWGKGIEGHTNCRKALRWYIFKYSEAKLEFEKAAHAKYAMVLSSPGIGESSAHLFKNQFYVVVLY